MKKRRRLRKGLAMLLSLAMVAGLVPAMSGGANTVKAASGSGTEPSVSAYATKTQLMDDTFAPKADGTAENYGKIVFGKNSSGASQEWYILGKDEPVSGDNTIIFAASPIATGQQFNSDTGSKTYNYEAGTGYGDSEGSKEVYPNHYGASVLRVVLQGMAKNTSYFTTAEQDLMNATTVTTKDTKDSATYTTTDKLYALAADGFGDSYKTIKAGTSDSTVLAKSSYWSSGDRFWLRSPYDYQLSCALFAIPGGYVDWDAVTLASTVQPASNLNLSSVLFASSAKAASSDTVSGTLTDGTAMTLRLNGTGKNIGTVTYNATTGDIKATKESSEGDVALVVQGKDGTNDWYYSKQIDASETVNASSIKSALALSSDIDLSTCKIWLEITDTDGLIYAVGATKVGLSSITSVEITGIDIPVSYTALDTKASCTTTGVSSTTPQITWTPSDSTAGDNISYTASITLTAGAGYEFTDSTTATVLGNTATSVTKNADGTLTVTYAFPATAKDKLIRITPQAITVANGTAYDAMNLPATVNIVTEGNTVTSAPVTWDTNTLASGSYDPAVLTEQTVTLNGTVDCPDSIDANGVSLTTTITITISAAGIVGAPTANPTAGTYSENQSVALTSSTEGATIYYTTDGSEPTITGGTTKQYTAPILVTGMEGQSIKTTIKAIAVKNGMQDSSVETFTYTIQIPYTYVTKTQLMDGTFAPNADGTAVNIGKIVFGKKSDGTTAQEWYILGKDAGVSGDNTIIFAASPIATGQVFEDDSYNKAFQSSFGVYASNPSEVYLNHYGASDLRVALKSMATDISYFTTAEQGLMNATTVTTHDVNNGVTYTTTDKLYALQGDYYNDDKLWAGTSDSTVLAMSSYWSNGSWFWLRSPYDNKSNSALLAIPRTYVADVRVNDGNAVQPASNLNLSSVLFASSAKAASSDTVSGTLTGSTAMTLRLNGTGKNIGTVTYNATTGDIKATKGSTEGDVALVVQGKDETNDWYYSKQIAGPETVNASDIKSALNLSSDIDLSACKIWLEITDTDGMIYAVGATEVLSITSVEITDIDTLVSNTALDNEAACVTTGVSSTAPSVKWTPNDSTAGYNTSYTASITLTADTGYEFTDSTTATVLGNTATSVTKNADGTLTVTYAFPATDKDKLTSITAPQPITVANGTAYSAMNLPEQVNIVTDGNTVSSAPVKWDTTTLVSGSYDPAVLTEQTVTLNGTITCPDSIDTNGIKPNTTITITISAADIVKAPTANPPAGAYTENKSVTLTSDTEGATIYYTTDGSEPTLTGSTPSGTTQKYTAPISVTGTEGQSVQTTIKAIAVKDRMQNSSVSTFSYTIAIPDISFIITGRILTENGASIEGNMTGLANYKNKEKVTLNVPVIAGYNFVGWYVYSESSANKYTGENLCTSRTYTFTAEADRNLVAVYKPIGSAELTIDGGTNFTINGETKSTEIKASYPLGSQITVVCNSDDFEYWKNSAGMVVSRDKSYAFTVTGKETISAVFNTKLENKATVVFESYYGQVIARDQYAEGSTLAETPGLPFRYGYTALGWDYNGDGTYSASEDTFAKALERGFDSEDKLVKILPVYQLNETTYRITVENGTGAGNYRQNEVVTVVANAASEGNKFSHWADGDGNILSYNEKYQFYAAKSITVTAVYVEDTEKVEAKGTTEIVDKYADKANGKLIFVSMSTVPEGCTIDKAGIIATNVESVGTSGDGFNADTAVYVRGNAWTGNAYRFTWYKSNVGSGENWYVRAYLVYTDAEGNVNTVYGDMVSLTMPE